MMYPLSEYDRTMKSKDWSKIPRVAGAATGEGETKWVSPDKFFDEPPAVLADAPPLPGEEARYAQVQAVLEAIKYDPAVKSAMIKAAEETEEQLIAPLLQFRNWANGFLTTGALSRMKPTSAPIISPALPLRIQHPRQRAERNQVLLPGP
jgi:hypothetical protein